MEEPRSNIVQLEDKPCPLCGSRRFTSCLHSTDQSGAVLGTFQIVRCLDCRLLYTNPRPTIETVLNCYPVDYGPHQVNSAKVVVTERPQGENTEKQADSSVRRPWYLSPAARSVPGLRSLYYWLTNDYSNFIPSQLGAGCQVVELGCAHGSFLEKLLAIGCDVEGVEPVTSAAHEAMKRGFHVHAGTLESAAFSNDSRDAIFAWMVVEHLLNPKETLLEIKRVLRPDGSLVFSVPNAGCWEPKVFGKSWFAYDLPQTSAALYAIKSDSNAGGLWPLIVCL